MKKFAYDFERELVFVESEIEKLQSSESADERSRKKLEELLKKREELFYQTYSDLDPWKRVLLARHPYRPGPSYYLKKLFSEFYEINSDGRFPQDPAVICGFAFFRGREVAVAAIDKGSDLKERQRKRFGMPLPEGYYKFIRLLKIAERRQLPVVTLVDTPGAYPGMEAEERGQAFAIANSIKEMLFVKTPTVAFITGEGGSGGALAMAVADRIYVFENAYYSVISPEGCASILFHDEKRASDAARVLKLTAEELFSLGLIHGIVREPFGSAYRNPEAAVKSLADTLENALDELDKMNIEQIVYERHEFFLKDCFIRISDKIEL